MMHQTQKRRRNRLSATTSTATSILLPRQQTSRGASCLATAVILGLVCLSQTIQSQEIPTIRPSSFQKKEPAVETAVPPKLASPPQPRTRRKGSVTATPNPPSSVATTTTTSPDPQQQQQHETEFMTWCEQVLGVYTVLEIQTFDYYDYMQALPVDDDWAAAAAASDTTTTTTNTVGGVESLPMIPVRGLAASRDIASGEVVIRIPLQALLTVSTTIDQDPVLSRVMGPQARRQHGWVSDNDDNDDSDNDDSTATDNKNEAVYLLEMPLLAVALLHHKKLGTSSPLAAYIAVLEASPVDSMPHMWSASKLLHQASPGVRTVARGIQLEVQDMYDTVVKVLIREHADLFGPPTTTTSSSGSSSSSRPWMFSFEEFQWAFSMVNSRHWQLPIQDLQSGSGRQLNEQSRTMSDDQASPPADMPTDEWVQEHADVDVDDSLDAADKKASTAATAETHSFLAPVADLLNFGPPCTTGRYNADSHSFEIVASCSFKKGQEVTFWYSDECDDIMAGSYGFTHPMVPVCPTAEEYRTSSEEWKERTLQLEEQLSEALDDLNYIYAELQRAEAILSGCDCCRYERAEPATKEPASRLRPEQPSVRGADNKAPSDHDNDIQRHGVRRTWQDRGNLEF